MKAWIKEKMTDFSYEAWKFYRENVILDCKKNEGVLSCLSCQKYTECEKIKIEDQLVGVYSMFDEMEVD